MKIFLLRHGETDWHKTGRLQGHTDIPLNEEGIEQINAVGDLVLKKGIHIDAIITSPLLRARMSAEIVAEKIGLDNRQVMIEPDFIERNFGEAEGLTREERQIMFPNGNYAGMESVEKLCDRAKNAIIKHVGIHAGKTLMIAAHGSVLKAIVTSVSSGKIAYSPGKEIIEVGKLGLLEYKDSVFEILALNFTMLTI